MLQLISLVLLAYSYFLVRTNLPKLPARIPTHFNAAGVADGWGSPDILWVLLGAQALTCVIFLIVPYVGGRYPNAIHVGSRRLTDFPASRRARVVAMLNDLTGYLNIVMNLFFVIMLHEIIRAATQPIPQLHMFWPMALLVGGTIGILWYYLGKFRQAAQSGDDGEPPAEVTP